MSGKRKPMTTTDKVTMVAQIVLSVLLFLGFFLALYFAWFSNAEISDQRLRIIDTMVGVLGTTFAMVISFWFARQRNAVKEQVDA
jgi:protein-S-isoprenylcysteine O-methyltransferase Ste14